MIRKKIFLIGIIFLVFLCYLNARATKIPFFKKQKYFFTYKEENIKQVLRDFCSLYGIPVVISEKVKGQVNGVFKGIYPKNFFEDIAKSFGLMWYFDGSVLYVYSSEEIESCLIRLRFKSIDRLKNTLKSLKIYDNRFPLREGDKDGIVFVSGPPKYVELVMQTAQLIDTPPSSISKEVIKIFPLKYAWASDHTFSVGDEEVTVPGVATLLKEILSGKGIENSSIKIKKLSQKLKGLKGEGLAAKYKKSKGEFSNRSNSVEDKESSDNSSQEKALSISSRVVADTRLNAVIIRDVEQRMPLYKELISLLDVPSGLVQIKAIIVDVSTDSLKELGLNWSGKGTIRDGKYTIEGGFNSNEGFTPGTEGLTTGDGFNLATTISLGTGQYILSRLRALEQKGNARIISRPSLLTINNVQAVIEQTQTFYTKVAGQEEVDLYDVTAGLVLKVTPHIVKTDKGERIKLIVDIEDGTISDTETVDSLPVVPKSTIHTQAVVSQDQFLMLGGYIYDFKTKNKKKVPVLGSIPLLGYLFRYSVENTTNRERIFLINCKIVKSSKEIGVVGEEFDKIKKYLNEKKYAGH
ncbi:type III secretion system outer membrane ring subunit SctC [Desulfothermus sp.]